MLRLPLCAVINRNACMADASPPIFSACSIWGDLQTFILESRDGDTEDRNFGPVKFNVSGIVDLVSPEQDQGWCFEYTCQKRLSTFWTYVPTWHAVNVSFTGVPPKVTRCVDKPLHVLVWP